MVTNKFPKENIINFLNCDEKKIDKDWLSAALFFAAAMLYVGVYFSKAPICLGIIVTALNIAFLILFFNIDKTLPFDKNHKYLFFGIYVLYDGFAFMFLSFQLLNPFVNTFILLLLQTFSVGIVGFCVYNFVIFKIKNNKYKSHESSIVAKISSAIILTSTLCASSILNSLSPSGIKILFGIMSGISALSLIYSIVFIMKYHFYKQYKTAQ